MILYRFQFSIFNPEAIQFQSSIFLSLKLTESTVELILSSAPCQNLFALQCLLPVNGITFQTVAQI